MNLTRAAWMEINLDKLKNNLSKIKENTSNESQIIAIVKANAYGFGANKIVETLIEENINFFAVATQSEALSLRKIYDNIKILILGYTPENLIEECIINEITLTIYSLEQAIKVNDISKKLNKKANIHLAIETGMNRIGFIVNENSIEEIRKISKLEYLYIEGMFSHFAASDSNRSYTEKQYLKFKEMINLLKNVNISIPIKHICNSHGILNYKEYNLDGVRPGIILYGSTEGIESKYEGFDVEYICEIKAKIANLKTLPEGEKISYGLTFETKSPTSVIATLPIGYADGILRQLSNKIQVLVNGVRCNQVGRICMDQMMIDVSDVNCSLDDEVVIVGKSGDEKIDILELARKAGEIATSYSCHFSKRLPKVYIKNGKVDEIVDEIM